MTNQRITKSLAEIIDAMREQLAKFIMPETPEDREVRLLAEARAEAEAARQQRVRILASQGAPHRAANCIAKDGVEDAVPVREGRLFMNGRKLVLVLHGPNDASKTLAAVVALDMAISRWLASLETKLGAPLMISAGKLERAWLYRDTTRDGSQPHEPDSGANRKMMKTCSLLVIDDLGQEHARSQVTLDAVEELVSDRCAANLRTLITTNLAGEQALTNHVGRVRFTERLTEHGILCACPFSGYRGRRGETEKRRRVHTPAAPAPMSTNGEKP